MSHLAIPIRHSVDLLVVGASSAAVAAAAAAARAGARVLVLAERPYLGEDLTGSLRLRCAAGDAPRSTLARQLFGDDGSQRPTPMQAKAACDEHLLAAGVSFLYGCFPYAVLRDAAGATAGAVIASRGGLFAVRAQVTVEATWRANLARLAGASFSPYPAGEQEFIRVVVGGSLRQGAGLTGSTDSEPITLPGKDGPQTFNVHRYVLRIAMADGSPASFAAAEARAGAMTFDPQQAKVGDVLWQVPPDALLVTEDNNSVPAVDSVTALQPNHFRTADAGLWVLGPCAALSRELAAELVQPATFLAVGEKLGVPLAAAAQRSIAAGPLRVEQAGAQPLRIGRLRTEQDPLRHQPGDCVAVPTDAIISLGTADVVVMGGGTAGAAAGIAAARQGARTIVCEYQSALGGVGTVGMISQYYFGNRVGFTAEIDAGTRAMGPTLQAPKSAGGWKIEWKQRWYQYASDQAGAQVWHGSIGCGVVLDGDTVRGILVATPWGVGVVACSVVVDASGNADIAAHAGAPTEVIGGEHVAVQGTGLGPRQPGHEYRNTDWTFVDDTDIVDTTQAMVVARNKFKDEFDLSTLIDSRERRRIIGDLSMSPLDFLAQRTFPDTITTAHSNFDTHGFTIHPLFLVEPPDKAPLNAHVPFRCLLPKTLANVAVTGLGKCAHRDALPVIRMQPDVQNEGYAMGVAAAWAARDQAGRLRAIDVATLQAHLVEIGILAADVPAHADSFPLGEERIAAALADPFGFVNLAVIFAHGDELRPRLGSAYAAAEGASRLRYALILGLLGDAAGADDLAAAIAGQGWDTGWNYKGMSQFGRSASDLDALIIALGRCGSARHAGVILAKLTALTAADAMSHSRAVAEACESLRLTTAAPAFAAVLALPGVSGHHQHDIVVARDTVDPDRCDNNTRNRSLRELHLARALYRVGDHHGIGARILKDYASDLRGIFARHAQAILASAHDAPLQRVKAG